MNNIKTTCQYDEPYAKCNNTVIKGSKFCVYHARLKCVQCQQAATHGCDNTGYLVCGAPLCEKHKHKECRWK
jgi:hypothetical protein